MRQLRRRVARGLIPACVEVCKSGALTYEEMDAAMRRKTTARGPQRVGRTPKPPPFPRRWRCLMAIKQC